jgi:hypothetical protein
LIAIVLDEKKIEDAEVKEFLKLYPKANEHPPPSFLKIPKFFTQVKSLTQRIKQSIYHF